MSQVAMERFSSLLGYADCFTDRNSLITRLNVMRDLDGRIN
jgi:hypothetical protein